MSLAEERHGGERSGREWRTRGGEAASPSEFERTTPPPLPAPRRPANCSWAMCLQKRADLPVEHVGTLEVRRMAGGVDAYEVRAGDMLVHLLGQLGPDEAVLFAGQEQGGDACGGVPFDRRGEAAELLAELRGQRRVQARDLRVEERANGLRRAERRPEG